MVDNALPAEPNTGDEGELQWYKQQVGRQGNEIGELRKTIDSFILKQDEASAPSFDEDPAAAIERAIEQKVKPIEQQLQQTQASAAEQKLRAQHPDYEQVTQSPEFQAFVNGSRIRTAAFEHAVAGDIDTGIDILNEYKAQNPGSADALNTALASNRGGSGEMGTRETGVYRRSDIVRKKIEDPVWYRDNEADIMQAYREGRVK